MPGVTEQEIAQAKQMNLYQYPADQSRFGCSAVSGCGQQR